MKSKLKLILIMALLSVPFSMNAMNLSNFDESVLKNIYDYRSPYIMKLEGIKITEEELRSLINQKEYLIKRIPLHMNLLEIRLMTELTEEEKNRTFDRIDMLYKNSVLLKKQIKELEEELKRF